QRTSASASPGWIARSITTPIITGTSASPAWCPVASTAPPAAGRHCRAITWRRTSRPRTDAPPRFLRVPPLLPPRGGRRRVPRVVAAAGRADAPAQRHPEAAGAAPHPGQLDEPGHRLADRLQQRPRGVPGVVEQVAGERGERVDQRLGGRPPQAAPP